MPLDVVEVHRAANPFDLHHAPGKRMQGRIVGDPPQVALEVPVVNRVEAHQGREQADVGLRQPVPDEPIRADRRSSSHPRVSKSGSTASSYASCVVAKPARYTPLFTVA